jgi:hypothetical protein
MKIEKEAAHCRNLRFDLFRFLRAKTKVNPYSWTELLPISNLSQGFAYERPKKL